MNHRQTIAAAIKKLNDTYGIIASMKGSPEDFWYETPSDRAAVFFQCAGILDKNGMLKERLLVSHQNGTAIDIDAGPDATYQPKTLDIFHKVQMLIESEASGLLVYAAGPTDGFCFVIVPDPFKATK